MYYPEIHECTRNNTRSRFEENNQIRRIVGGNRADKRRMGEMRVEFGVKESIKKKLVTSRLT